MQMHSGFAFIWRRKAGRKTLVEILETIDTILSESKKRKRNILKNIHYIGCLGKKSEDLWIEVAEYIDKNML